MGRTEGRGLPRWHRCLVSLCGRFSGDYLHCPALSLCALCLAFREYQYVQKAVCHSFLFSHPSRLDALDCIQSIICTHQCDLYPRLALRPAWTRLESLCDGERRVAAHACKRPRACTGADACPWVGLVSARGPNGREGSSGFIHSGHCVLLHRHSGHALVAAMTRSELLSRILITAAVLGAVGAPLFFWARIPLVHARIAENGGWNPDVIQAKVGVPLHLSLTSDDVVHGFTVGQMDMSSVDVLPGKVTNIVLTFSQPGTYTFYCTRWCGLNHWRMRGKIEVSGPDLGSAPVVQPLYVTLGLDIDAPHNAPVVPTVRPSAINGQYLATGFPISQLTRPDYYRAHSPYQLFEDLNSTGSEELGMRPLVAHCQHGLGMLYARTGQAEHARAALCEALELYRAMDMTFWLPQTEAALAQ